MVAERYFFATSGIMARPAGVAGMMASDKTTAPMVVFHGQIVPKGVLRKQHALAVQSPYAEVDFEAREAIVQPNQKCQAAGATNPGGGLTPFTQRPCKKGQIDTCLQLTKKTPSVACCLLICGDTLVRPADAPGAGRC